MNAKTVDPHTLAKVRQAAVPPRDTQLKILYYMKLVRELEDRIERKLYRQGKIVGGVYVGRGQEAIAVGSCIDLRADDVVCPSHRDMGAFLIRGMSLRTIFAQYMGRKTGATKGKDSNMHMGSLEHNLIAFISMLGDSVPVAAGIGLSFKMRGQDRVVVCSPKRAQSRKRRIQPRGYLNSDSGFLYSEAVWHEYGVWFNAAYTTAATNPIATASCSDYSLAC